MENPLKQRGLCISQELFPRKSSYVGSCIVIAWEEERKYFMSFRVFIGSDGKSTIAWTLNRSVCSESFAVKGKLQSHRADVFVAAVCGEGLDVDPKVADAEQLHPVIVVHLEVLNDVMTLTREKFLTRL